MPAKKLEEFRKQLPNKYKPILDIGLSTGLRITDILELKVYQLKIQKPTICEKKTGKSKRIYIPAKSRKELLRACRNLKDDDFVFSSGSKTGHLTRQAVFKAFKSAAQKCKIKENIAPHSMRKTYACKLLGKKKDYKYIQTKLNHKWLNETLIYVFDMLKGE